MDTQLTNRVALVCGGHGLIGSAVVESLRAEGATVIAASRSSSELTLDVTHQGSVNDAVDRIITDHGRLDIVVMTAGTRAQQLDPAAAGDPEAIASAIYAKAISMVRVANVALPRMREQGWGRFVAINGQNTYFTGSVMAAARNAALAFAAKTLADQYAGTGVTVNIVNPGPVTETPAAPPAVGPGESTPQNVAAAVTFLASGLAGSISGEALATGHKARMFTTY